MDISVVVLTRNRQKMLSRCLDSLQKSRIKAKYEVLVIDNCSTDGTLGFLEKERKKMSNLVIIHNSKNMGVGKARNVGIRHSSGKYLFFLDDDAEVKPDALAVLYRFMEKNSDCWVAGPKTFRPDGRLEYSARTFYTLPVILLRRTFLGSIFPRSKIVRKHLMADWDHDSARAVDWVAGAGMMIPRRAFDEIGGFESTTFGFEDVDLCYRVHEAGKQVRYVPDAVIIHHVAATSKKFGKNYFRHLWSAFKFLVKHKGFKKPSAQKVIFDENKNKTKN